MMETFSDFIQKQFEENAYSVLGIVHEGVLFLKNNEHEDYWLVAVGVECYQNQDILFQEMQSTFYKEYPLAVKNTSLLILYDTKTDLLGRNALIEIENDPLYFKKYVLCYTNKSHEELVKILKGSTVADKAMENEAFTCMLKEKEFGPASLLYNIMHKLPFIPIKGQSEKIQTQEIYYSAGANPNELVAFLETLPNNEDGINKVVADFIKTEDYGEIVD